ncbi:MAG: chemotaxis protein CheX [Myxococcales bacterium]|nr:MAG: chemotaxis protein CheX [Myxococcales bacterium]
MEEAWKTALTRAIREVFENLCFMMPAPRATVPPEPKSLSRVVLAVDIHGAGQGSLHLILPEAMVAPIAASMLGDDEPLSLAEQYDAACELANIVCGNVLPLVAGERAVFDLSPPRVIATMDPGLDVGSDARVAVLLDEGLVCASLHLRLAERQGAA